MDRETRRALEEYRRNDAGQIENNLIDELVNGEVDRAEFLRRGTMFGLSAGIIGSALALRRRGRRRPDDRTATRGRQGRGHDPARAADTGSPARALPPERRRDARVRRHPGRVPDVHQPPGTGSPDAGDDLEGEQGRNRLDVPAPQGRALPQRQGDDVRRRGCLDEAVRRQGIERRPQPRSSTPPECRRAADTPSCSGSRRRSARSRTC